MSAKGSQVFDAVAEGSRREILDLIAAGPRPVGEIATETGLSQPNASRHLRILREAGLVEARVEGEPRPVPTAIGVAAYRILQEALTNVIKHAGPAHASVLIRYTDDDVTLEVRDDGHGPTGATNGGHGLVGMRERAAVHGGELVAGPAANGGFVVTARLPLPTAR